MDDDATIEDLRRRLAEATATNAALRAAEERYRPIFQAMDEGYLLADVLFDDAGRAIDIAYVEANPAATRMVGIDLTGRRLREVNPDYEEYWYEIWGRVATAGHGERLERYASPEGIWYNFYVFKPQPEDRDSRRVAVLFQDVTQRKRAEIALRESEARMRAVLQQAPLAIVFTGPSGEIQFHNAMFDALWGRPAHATTAETYSEVYEGYHLDGRPVASGEWPGARAVLRGETVSDEMLEIVRADGHRIACWFAAGPIRDEVGEVVGGVVLFRDVSEERRVQVVLRESEERQAFLLGLSDALRPLLDPVAVQAAASRLLGEHLGVERAAYGEMERDDLYMTVERDWRRPGVASTAGRFQIDAFGTFFTDPLRAGAMTVIEDAASDPRIPAERYASTWALIGVRAAVAHPIVKDGRFVAAFFVHHGHPRQWSDGELRLVGEVAERTWEAVERARAEAALRASEERQAFLLDLSDMLRPLSDPAAIQHAAMKLLAEKQDVMRAGYLDVHADGDTMTMAARYERDAVPVPPQIRLSDYGADIADAFRAGRTLCIRDTEAEGEAESHRAAHRAIGVRSWIIAPLVKGGRLIAIVGVVARTPRDWTSADMRLVDDVAERTWAALERANAEAALRESEERQRLTVELVPALLWQADPAGHAITANERWKSYTGQSDVEIRDHDWLDAIHPDDLEATRAAFAHAFATGEALERQQRIRRADGAQRWHLVRHVPVRDGHGVITRWFGAAIDIEDLHALQERQGVLVAELQHRTRNLMGVVRAMADKTMSRAADLADFRARFTDRLAALARVQGLLSRLAEGERITFDDLIRAEMAALTGTAEKVTLDGPRGVALRSSTVQTFALALHELSTNATKHGAFAQPGGRLDIRWRVERAERDGRPWLHVDWRERGVAMPAAVAPPQGGGSGRELIERALPYQLGAHTTYVMEADGVHCTIALPVSDRQTVRETADA